MPSRLLLYHSVQASHLSSSAAIGAAGQPLAQRSMLGGLLPGVPRLPQRPAVPAACCQLDLPHPNTPCLSLLDFYVV